MNMRQSRVLRELRAGRTVFSVKLNSADPRVTEMAALHGIGCIWTDVEHVGNDWSVIENQIYAAKAHDADVLVRVARGSYSDYIRPLELDAAGIMVPHVMSARDAREVVRMTRFHPVGLRPVDGGNADGAYCMIPAAEYARQANENRFVIVQIEDPEAMDELEDIASVEGVDMLFFGPGDYSHRLGVLGQLDHPEVNRARVMVARAAMKHGKYAGTVGSPAVSRTLADMGYRFINLGSDVAGLLGYFGGIADHIRSFE